MLSLRVDDLSGEPVRALLSLHLAGMHASSPACHVHALDVSGLRAPNVTVWTAWDGEALAGVGALKQLSETQAEIKSMRTHPDHLRKGVGLALLDHIISEARGRGVRRLSLETGRGEAFEPALALYRRRGFVSGGPFGQYEADAFSQFLHMPLDDQPYLTPVR
jgi:putative acetyltransferase